MSTAAAASVGPGTRALFPVLAHRRLWATRFSLTVRILVMPGRVVSVYVRPGGVGVGDWGPVGIRPQKQVD